jgi:hypothetical protein
MNIRIFFILFFATMVLLIGCSKGKRFSGDYKMSGLQYQTGPYGRYDSVIQTNIVVTITDVNANTVSVYGNQAAYSGIKGGYYQFIYYGPYDNNEIDLNFNGKDSLYLYNYSSSNPAFGEVTVLSGTKVN